MTALAGAWRCHGGPGAGADCALMMEAQALYGPHDRALWDGGAIALGRRLFRLLPEDRFDPGPIGLPGGAWLTADVRLDNREDLTSALGLAHGPAALLADVGLLAAAWTRWGEEMFDQLVGDYALAVWDPGRQSLILARDPLGHRPLHFHRGRGLVAFASMPRGLHALAEIPLAPDEQSLAAFVALEPEVSRSTFFAGIERVEPGTLVSITRDALQTRRHYAPHRRELRLKTADAYAEALREQLDLAVGARLRGAGPVVGAHLSSGWDSGAVAATAARLTQAKGGRVLAFTAAPRAGYDAAPPGRHADESLGAAEVAALYDNLDLAVLRSSGRSPLDGLDRDIALSGRPALNPCNHLWFDDINRAARAQGVQVVLTGDYGNLGLTDDGLDLLPGLAASGRWRSWLGLALAARRDGALGWAGVIASLLSGRVKPGTWRAVQRLAGRGGDDLRRASPLHPDLRGQGPRVSADPGDRFARRLATLNRIDLSGHAKGALATHGVDVRDPLTDRRLIEFCLSVPIGQLWADGRPRALARLALADRLPKATLDRTTRGYQGADWHEGLSADRAGVTRDLDRLGALPAAARLLDLDRLRALAAAWPSGGWHQDETLSAYRLTLLRGLAVGRFLTHTLRANG